MRIKYAKPSEIIQPKGGLIIEEQKEKDWILGATDKVLQPTGQWDDYLPVPELQKALDGDTYGCVSFSLNNVHETLHKRLYGYEINKDDRFLVVGSGTVQNQGNGVGTVAEWSRKNGFLLERFQQLALSKYYEKPTAEDIENAKKMLDVYESNYWWLPKDRGYTSSQQDTWKNALKFSPLQVSVDGSNYNTDSEGRIGGFVNYTHEVELFGYTDSYAKVFDSETLQWLKFRLDYPFGYCMAHSFKKKIMKIYKKVGQPAMAFKHWSEDSLIAFADGSIPGGDLFKSLFGTSDYSLIPREDVEEWPYPIKYHLTTTGLLSALE